MQAEVGGRQSAAGERLADGLQRPGALGRILGHRFDVDGRLADGQTERRVEFARGADGDETIVGETDGVARAEIADLYLAAGRLHNANVVLGNVQVLNDAAGDIVARAAAADLEQTGRVVELLLLQLVGNSEAKHGAVAPSRVPLRILVGLMILSNIVGNFATENRRLAAKLRVALRPSGSQKLAAKRRRRGPACRRTFPGRGRSSRSDGPARE